MPIVTPRVRKVKVGSQEFSSEKMLAGGKERVEQNGWRNVFLWQGDARMISSADLEIASGQQDFQLERVICSLGLSVIPEWEQVFHHTFDLLAGGDRYTILDLYYEKPTFESRITNLMARSDVSRRVWEPLQARSEDFNLDKAGLYSYGNSVGTVIIASGARPMGK